MHGTGTYLETKAELESYGIPTDRLPVDEHGTIFSDYHREWVKQRRLQESSGLEPTAIIPRRFDGTLQWYMDAVFHMCCV